MDRLIAPGTVIAAQADAAPATGTPGYATDGNPATGVLATEWPAYQYNSLQEELIAFLTASAIAPDRTKNNQILAACRALFAAIGGSATQTFLVAPATQSQAAMQLGQATGRLLNVQRFTSSGTYTPTAGTTRVVIKGKGGGGGSGGSAGTASNTVSAGGPGTEGGYFETLLTTGFAGIAITVGAAGAAGTAGGAGGSGGDTSFTASGLTVFGQGGFGGGVTGTSTLSVVAGPAGNAAAGNGNIINANGDGGGQSQCFALGGSGVATPAMGGGGTSPASAAVKWGNGGGGTANGFAQAAIVGRAGFQGFVEIWEYS